MKTFLPSTMSAGHELLCLTNDSPDHSTSLHHFLFQLPCGRQKAEGLGEEEEDFIVVVQLHNVGKVNQVSIFSTRVVKDANPTPESSSPTEVCVCV